MSFKPYEVTVSAMVHCALIGCNYTWLREGKVMVICENSRRTHRKLHIVQAELVTSPSVLACALRRPQSSFSSSPLRTHGLFYPTFEARPLPLKGSIGFQVVLKPLKIPVHSSLMRCMMGVRSRVGLLPDAFDSSNRCLGCFRVCKPNLDANLLD